MTAREESAFDRLCADLRRCPTLAEDDIDFYLESTRSRLYSTPGDLPEPGESKGSPRANGGGPTPRELDVLKCASRGLTSAMTASTLGIGTETVHTHLAHVRAKLKAKTTAQAVANAIRQQLIP